SSRVGFGVVKIPGNKIRNGNAVDLVGKDFARVADFDQVLDLMSIGSGIDVRLTDEFVAHGVAEHFKKLVAGGDAPVVARLIFIRGPPVRGESLGLRPVTLLQSCACCNRTQSGNPALRERRTTKNRA